MTFNLKGRYKAIKRMLSVSKGIKDDMDAGKAVEESQLRSLNQHYKQVTKRRGDRNVVLGNLKKHTFEKDFDCKESDEGFPGQLLEMPELPSIVLYDEFWQRWKRGTKRAIENEPMFRTIVDVLLTCIVADFHAAADAADIMVDGAELNIQRETAIQGLMTTPGKEEVWVTGKADHTVFHGDPNGLENHRLVIEVKQPDTFSGAFIQKRQRENTPIWGILTDGNRYTFYHLDGERRYSSYDFTLSQMVARQQVYYLFWKILRECSQ
ncbi:hypothetical protein BDV25DRAFT_135473 [Aspergillus avenaceus]|uniref:Uncharacterized protein n=1 Tax=Aspergillus avenaceus TaxID=36643 RepID=A0A5N6U8C1_ASPAV|nr:hypothetical protein BDV25DRAFT_135473 [Aspergillus avenaceus]